MSKEIYLDLNDEDVRIYFDEANRNRIMESSLVNKALSKSEQDDLNVLLERLDNGKSVVLYCNFSGYVDVDDDDLDYDDGYNARVEEEENENARIRANYGSLIQKLTQIRDGWGKYANDNTISKEEADILLKLLDRE